jgi:hypothetical protein
MVTELNKKEAWDVNALEEPLKKEMYWISTKLPSHDGN